MPTCALADPYIAWIDPPEEIEIPASRETNIFLKVKVTETRPGQVYLAAADGGKDGARVALSQTGAEEYALNLSDPLVVTFARKADLSQGVRAFANLGGGRTISSVVLRVKLSPKVKPIVLNCDALRVTQRDYVNLPGSNGQLQLYISDISSGMTKVSILSDDGIDVFSATTMRAGESNTFKIRDDEYTIVCERLYNFLMGSDYGTFRVCKTTDWNTYRIDRLVRMIEESDAMFVAGKEQKTGAEFAAVLKARIRNGSAEQKTFEAFMNAARKVLDGNSQCDVHTKDGKILGLADWYAATWKNQESTKTAGKPSESPPKRE